MQNVGRLRLVPLTLYKNISTESSVRSSVPFLYLKTLVPLALA